MRTETGNKSIAYQGALIFNQLEKTNRDEIAIFLFKERLKLSKFLQMSKKTYLTLRNNFLYLRANDSPFMTKALRKAMMHRKKLRNRYIKRRTEESLKAFKEQRNFCVKLLRKTKSDYYRNLNLGDLTDNHKFWKTVKPVFSNEIQTSSSVTLIEDGKMITDDAKIAEIFNHYFANITESLGIFEDQSFLSETTGINDPVEKAIKKYKNHPSIKMI